MSMSSDNLIRLRDDLDIVSECHGANVFGRVFEASEIHGGDVSPTRRIVRVFETTSIKTNWTQPLLERIEKLLPLRLPYIATPIDAGVTPDSIFIVGDMLGQPLGASCRGFKGLPPDEVRRIATQLLTGLAALHKEGISHGDVRPQNVYYASDRGSGESAEVWIVDAAIGGLAWWSSGEFKDADAAAYRPPEWNGKTQQPSAKADLYALGLTILELLLGKQGNPIRQKGAGPLEVRKLLAEKKAPDDLRELIMLLLAPAQDRPADASVALARFEALQTRRSRRPWQIAAASVGLLFICCCIALVVVWGSRAAAVSELNGKTQEFVEVNTALRNEKEKHGKTITERDSHSSDVNGLESKVSELEAEIDRLKGSGGPPPPPSAEEVAKDIWRESFSETFLLRLKYDNITAAFKAEKRKEVRESLGGWLTKVKRLHADAGADWINSDAELKRLLIDFARNPWDTSAEVAAQERWRNLKEAADKWIEWAANPDMRWADITGAIAAQPDRLKGILNKWKADTEARKGWKLRLTRGTAGKDAQLGTERLITIYAPSKHVGAVHQWKTPESHAYTSSDAKVREIQFEWKADESIQVYVEGDWSWYTAGVRPNIAERTVNGPLAPYRLHRMGGLTNGASNKDELFKLEFGIVDCPGPPRSYKKPLSSSQLQRK